MAILRSSHKVGETTPKAKSFKELLSRLGQRSQLAAPKYADSTKQMNGFVWGRWTQFCQKVYDESSYFTSPDPIDVCKNHLHYEVVRSFLEWSCQISRITSSASLFTYAKAWRMGVIQYTRSPVDPAIKMDMKNFIMDTLIDQFELKQTGRFRGVVNADDVVAILYHWVLCDDYYPEERQRLQHAIMDIFCSSTTARAGTVVESSCYFGRNEAVEYDSQDQSEESIEASEVKPCFLDTEPDIYPMQCPGTQCLFCLGDVGLAANIRTRCFANPFSLTRHVHKQHLQYLLKGQPFTCPHPSCSMDGFLLQDSNHYKNHALMVHSVAHSA